MVFTFSTRWRTRHTSTRRRVSAHTPPAAARPLVRTRMRGTRTHSHTCDHSSARQTGHRRRSRPLSTESCPRRHADYYYYYVTLAIRNRPNFPLPTAPPPSPPLLLLPNLLRTIFFANLPGTHDNVLRTRDVGRTFRPNFEGYASHGG